MKNQFQYSLQFINHRCYRLSTSYLSQADCQMRWIKRINHYTHFALLLCCMLVFFTNSLQAQRNIHILDAFYEALSQNSTDRIAFDLEGGQFLLDDYRDQEVSPQKIIERHPDAKKYLIQDSIFYIKGEFFLTGKLIDLYDFDPSVNIKNFHFDRFEPDITVFNPSSTNEIFYGSSLRLINVKAFRQIRSSGGGNIQLSIQNSEIKDLTFALVYPPTIRIRNSKIDLLLLALLETDLISVEDSKIEQMNIRDIQTDQLLLRNNIFEPAILDDVKVLQDSTSYMHKAILGNQPFQIIRGNLDRFVMSANEVKTNGQDPIFEIGPKGGSAKISNNTFDCNVILSARMSASFELENNSFQSVSLLASLPTTPQNYVKIDWEDLKGKLSWKLNKNSPTYYGKNELELADEGNYNSLISSYRKLVQVYKNNGNTTDANSAYLEMKDLEGGRYQYINKTEGGMTNLFQLKLHQLLSAYTRHGTNPAQAITASVWLMFLFGIVYFFFPSDWDEKSKKQLIADFRIFTQKNEHGYFLPFLKLVKGFVISLFNAFVLSVNSFVTLGFGRIPTHGFAKYICILEGFLGWFLLSIFIVSLINQVLF